MLCVDKTKFNANFPDHQFKISGYQIPPLTRDSNCKRGVKIVFVFECFIVRQMKTFAFMN